MYETSTHPKKEDKEVQSVHSSKMPFGHQDFEVSET